MVCFCRNFNEVLGYLVVVFPFPVIKHAPEGFLGFGGFRVFGAFRANTGFGGFRFFGAFVGFVGFGGISALTGFEGQGCFVKSWHINESGPRQDLWKAFTEIHDRLDGLP